MNQPAPDHAEAYPSHQLAAKIASGELSEDVAQMAAAQRLDAVVDALCHARQQGWIKRLLRPPHSVTGLYLYGGVGRGKTMLMDMFVSSLGQHRNAPQVWRVHFHDFMVLAQDSIHAARQAHLDDPIAAAAKSLAQRGTVVCFDEMEVRDIADAMILARLFTMLMDRGVTVVATSNRHADDLYKDGLHRDRFLPFIALLKSRCDMFALAKGIDWRGQVLASLPAWYQPLGAATSKRLAVAFRQVSGDAPVTREIVRVAGRDIAVEKVAGDVGYASFASLCDVPLAARDYLALAGRFAGVVLADIPQFTETNEHTARRFMWLIDALYDRRRFLIASAQTDIKDLYKGHQWQFEFDRTASRLGEMVTQGRPKSG
jgi:cell division protein ZapE